MLRLAVLLCLVLLSAVARADRTTFLLVAPEPTNYAWWLRAEYNPFSKTVRGIPIKLLSKQWCYANEFSADLFPAKYMQDISPELSFSVESQFGQKRKLTALVGAFETCTQEKGLFLLILEQKEAIKVVRFLEQFSFQQSLAALRLTNRNTLELWWCSSCDNSQELEWNARQRKFVWRSEDDDADDAHPINPPDLSRQAAPVR